ncbi:MAG: hypothetical protein IT346_00670, partial [Epsilonproteobacteria bacterium]|nr:hypothetical protein [Campylobacterota bacterium]
GLYKLGSYAYRSFSEWRENQIVERAAEDLFIALTTNATIDLMSEPQRTAAFRKKAQLVQLRRNVLEKVKNELSELSLDQQDVLQEQFLKNAMGLSSVIDKSVNAKVPMPNPCRENATDNYIYDDFVEDNMVESILLKYKSNLTPEEKTELKKLEERRKKIIDRMSVKKRAWLRERRQLKDFVSEGDIIVSEGDMMRMTLFMPNV